MIAVIIESLLDNSDRRAALEQRPDQVVIVNARKIADGFIQPADFQQFSLAEEEKVFEIAGLRFQCREFEISLVGQRGARTRVNSYPIGIVSGKPGTDDVRIDWKATGDGFVVQPVVGKKQSDPVGARLANA